MIAADLKKQLELLLNDLKELPQYGYEPCCRLQNIFSGLKALQPAFLEFSLPGSDTFVEQLEEIENNINGLTTDDKGRDLESFKAAIYHKSQKDLIVFIRDYLKVL